MKRNDLTGIFVLGLMFVFITLGRAQGLKEGQWSMTMVTKMDNMSPQMVAAMKQMENMPPEAKAAMQQMQQKMGVSMSADGQGVTITATHCITNQNPVPKYIKNKDMEDRCQQTHEINGNTVTFHSNCNYNDTQIESSGNMTYSDGSMQGEIKSHQTRAGKTIDSTVDITGQYVGPC
jgi:hypothetical protein